MRLTALIVWEILIRPLRPFEEQRYQELMQTHHYLGSLAKIGETLWYFATWRNQWVAAKVHDIVYESTIRFKSYFGNI
jgi:hypothetical protein